MSSFVFSHTVSVFYIFYLSLSLSLSLSLLVCLSVSLSLSVNMSQSLSVSLSIYICIYIYVSVSVYIYIYISVMISVFGGILAVEWLKYCTVTALHTCLNSSVTIVLTFTLIPLLKAWTLLFTSYRLNSITFFYNNDVCFLSHEIWYAIKKKELKKTPALGLIWVS